MSSPLVSVVIPAYNAERTITAAIGSVLEQTVDDLEVIVVDDGSTDRTVEVAAASGDRRVQVVRQANAGPSVARNTGLARAGGKYVALLDADDLWLPRKVERQLEVLERQPGVGAVQTGALFVDDDLRELSVRRCRSGGDALLETLLFENLPAFPSTVMFDRSKLAEIGGFDTSLVILEDWNLAIEAARRCNLQSIEEPLALYRVHPGNRSRDLGIHVASGYQVLSRLFTSDVLPEPVKRRRRLIYARFYTMLAGGAYRNREWGQWARWTSKAVLTHPASMRYMAELPLRRIARRPAAR